MPRPPSARHSGRIDLSARDINLPGVMEIGSYHYRSARQGLQGVNHGDSFGVCHLVRGVQTYRVNGTIYHLRGGDQLLTLPGESLDTAGTPEEKGHLYWFIFSMRPLNGPLLFLEKPAAKILRQTLLALPHRHFEARPNADQLAATILNTLQTRPDKMIARLAIAQDILRYLFQLIATVDLVEDPRLSPRIQRCLEHIDAHLHESLPVPQLAALVGLSESRFKNRFRDEVGVPPGDFVLRRKIKAACHALIQPDAVITAIAHDLGFSSSQYFATVFRRFIGSTPSGYRNNIQRNQTNCPS